MGGGSLAAFSVFLSLSLILFLYNIK